MIQIDLSKYSENGVYTDIGYSFERYVVDLLKKCGWNAYKTQSTGDFGADVIAEKDGIKYAVQCKYGSADIGNKALYEAVAGRDYYKCDKAACITNCDYTNSAKEYAKKTGVILWNQYDLQKFIKQAETPSYTEYMTVDKSEFCDFEECLTEIEYYVKANIDTLKLNEREMCQAYNYQQDYQVGRWGDYESFDNMSNYYCNENNELVNKGNACKRWYTGKNAERVRIALDYLQSHIEDDWFSFENEKLYFSNFEETYLKIKRYALGDIYTVQTYIDKLKKCSDEWNRIASVCNRLATTSYSYENESAFHKDIIELINWNNSSWCKNITQYINYISEREKNDWKDYDCEKRWFVAFSAEFYKYTSVYAVFKNIVNTDFEHILYELKQSEKDVTQLYDLCCNLHHPVPDYGGYDYTEQDAIALKTYNENVYKIKSWYAVNGLKLQNIITQGYANYSTLMNNAIFSGWLPKYLKMFNFLYQTYAPQVRLNNTKQVQEKIAKPNIQQKVTSKVVTQKGKTPVFNKKWCFIMLTLSIAFILFYVGKYIALKTKVDLSAITAFGFLFDAVTWIVLGVRSRLKKEDKANRAIIHRTCFLILSFCSGYLAYYPIN